MSAEKEYFLRLQRTWSWYIFSLLPRLPENEKFKFNVFACEHSTGVSKNGTLLAFEFPTLLDAL